MSKQRAATGLCPFFDSEERGSHVGASDRGTRGSKQFGECLVLRLRGGSVFHMAEMATCFSRRRGALSNDL